MQDYDRVRAWCAATMALRAEHSVPVGPGGWLLLSPSWPDSFVNNALVLTADPGPQQVQRWVANLGRAGITHRQVTAYCSLSAATVWSLENEQYELQSEVLMARPTTKDPIAAPPVPVGQHEPDAAIVGRLQATLWRQEWLPDADDAVVGQLVARRAELARAGSTTTLAVTEEDRAVACIDVCVRDGVGELDALATLDPYRGRGYGLALMAAGVALVAGSGCDLVALTALKHDWPRTWYSRLGFTELGPATEATLAGQGSPGR